MITTCIGSNNNLNYLKLAVKSVRKNHYYKNNPLLIFSENSEDGTVEWLQENKDKYNFKYVYHKVRDENGLRGIGGSMNMLASLVTTEYINFIHADMYVAENQDLELFKLFNKQDKPLVASSYRIEPCVFDSINRPGTFKTNIFGDTFENFEEQLFLEFSKEFSALNNTTYRKAEGVSFMIRKKDWDFIGGNDPIFNPLSFDDMDLFIRMQNANFHFIQTSKSVVFHFGSRSANGHFPTDTFKRSDRQKFYEERNAKLFIDKWGERPEFDEVGFIKPIKKVK
jgi:GT2 family glycosyltransferase